MGKMGLMAQTERMATCCAVPYHTSLVSSAQLVPRATKVAQARKAPAVLRVEQGRMERTGTRAKLVCKVPLETKAQLDHRDRLGRRDPLDESIPPMDLPDPRVRLEAQVVWDRKASLALKESLVPLDLLERLVPMESLVHKAHRALRDHQAPLDPTARLEGATIVRLHAPRPGIEHIHALRLVLLLLIPVPPTTLIL